MSELVHGNLDGLREAVRSRLAALLEREPEPDAFLSRALMRELAELSNGINREVAVYLTRDGDILDVAVGTDAEVELRDLRLRRSSRRLSRGGTEST